MWSASKIIKIVLVSLLFSYVQIHKWLETALRKGDINPIFNANAVTEGDTIESIHQFLAITIKLENQSSRLCGGSFISERYVLTAAHCLDGSQFAILNLKTSIDTENRNITLMSDKFIIHPKWKWNILLNDIALIEIPPRHITNFPPNKIKLSINDTRMVNKVGMLYGWERNASDANAPPVLKTHRVIVIQNKVCKKLFGSLMRKTNVCTNASQIENGCRGFSGGPLLVDGMLVGIVSFGTTECHAGYPTVHTRVSAYRKWIQENTHISNIAWKNRIINNT